MTTVKISEDREVELKKPTARQLADAQSYSAKLFTRLINETDEAGNHTAIFEPQLHDHMKKLGLWSDAEEARLKEIDYEMGTVEVEAAQTKSKSRAKELAFKLWDLRDERYRLIGKKNQLNNFTVEAQVNNAKFDYLVSSCVFNSDGSRFYISVDDYKEKADSADGYKVASELQKLVYGITEDLRSKLVENKILRKVGAMNDDYQLVDENGNTVDRHGKRVDKDGYYVDTENRRVDDRGTLIDVKIEDAEYTED